MVEYIVCQIDRDTASFAASDTSTLSVSNTTARISLVPQFARTRENLENYLQICNRRVAKKHKCLSLYAYTESRTS